MKNMLRGVNGNGMALGLLLGILGGLIFLAPAGASFGTGDCVVVCDEHGLLGDALAESLDNLTKGVEYLQDQLNLLVSASGDMVNLSLRRGVDAAKFIQRIVALEVSKVNKSAKPQE